MEQMEIHNQEQKNGQPVSGIVSRKFRGIWIPATIWLNPKLTLIHKVFLAEIESLSGDQNCFASNQYFAEFFGISKRYVSKVIAELRDMKLITVQLIYKPNSKEVQKRVIRCVGYEQPIEMIVVEKPADQEQPVKQSSMIKPVVELLNGLTGGSFRHTTDSTRKHINARIADGATMADFELVIRDRFTRWNNDPKMREYLRPSTLFGSKFESYLNAAKTQPAPNSKRATRSVDHSALFGEHSNQPRQ